MTELRGRWPSGLRGLRSDRRQCPARHALAPAPERKRTTTWRLSFGSISRCWPDRLLHRGGADAARAGDLLRVVFHPSREPPRGHRRDHGSPGRAVDAADRPERDHGGMRCSARLSLSAARSRHQVHSVLRTITLKIANGDIFGRIYEYFLTQFADLKAHDGGEFLHPRIARAADRERHRARSWHGGRSSLRFGRDVRAKRPLYRGAQKRPSEQATFYGMEKNPTTIRLAKMNLRARP